MPFSSVDIENYANKRAWKYGKKRIKAILNEFRKYLEETKSNKVVIENLNLSSTNSQPSKEEGKVDKLEKEIEKLKE
jgi:hypothetical protein